MRINSLKCNITVLPKLLWISLSVAFFMMQSSVHAEENAKFGKTNIAFKVGELFFKDHFISNGYPINNNGIYIGLEAYRKIKPNLYLGGGTGFASELTLGKPKIELIPIEINLKYAIEPVSNCMFDIGAGPSFSYSSIRTTYFLSEKESDWLMGGQFFADILYKIHWFHLGMETKYQITQSFKDTDFTFSNFRVGGKFGINF